MIDSMMIYSCMSDALSICYEFVCVKQRKRNILLSHLGILIAIKSYLHTKMHSPASTLRKAIFRLDRDVI
jgi:hypothetical protein